MDTIVSLIEELQACIGLGSDNIARGPIVCNQGEQRKRSVHLYSSIFEEKCSSGWTLESRCYGDLVINARRALPHL